jgi:ribosome-associated heat shock protein Hsp15
MTDQKAAALSQEIRIDKWLWAARFFKTRSLAAQAATGGKVDVNGVRARPSRTVRVGDQLAIRRGLFEWIVTVTGIAKHRGPASEAQRLYEESDASKQKRQAIAVQLKLQRPPEFNAPSRPSKKERRAIRKFTHRGW